MSQYIDNQGYIRIYDPTDPCSDSKGYIYEHRKKMAEQLRQDDPEHPALDINGCLKPNWMVHHDDEDKSNNNDGNLHLKKITVTSVIISQLVTRIQLSGMKRKICLGDEKNGKKMYSINAKR